MTVCVCVWKRGFWDCKPPEHKIGNNEQEQELKANIYRALICIGSSELPVWVSVSMAELRNTEGHGW